MTPFQQQCLQIINHLLATDPRYAGGWLRASYVCAHIEIESAWNPDAVSSDGLGSIGLLQCLPSTAASVGMGPGYDQRVPANSIEAGMRYIAVCHHAITLHHFGPTAQPPPYDPYCVAAYNCGLGNVFKGNLDPVYVARWREAQKAWAYVDSPVT